MKLNIPARDLRRDLAEFDIWITPSLGEINQTDKFKEELARITRIFEDLGIATKNFQDIATCQPVAIAETFAKLAAKQTKKDRAELFKSLASTLYLVTGKSDNNTKCQFPLFLRDVAGWSSLPVKKGAPKALPRTLRSDDYMDLVAVVENSADESRLLEQFLSFLLIDEDAVRQFWSLGHSYYVLKQLGQGYERNLLSPIVIFKVRGSVSASGGHEPEALLREHLESWGLVADYDYNTNDVIVDGAEGGKNDKTRAYDFVLPYKTEGWFPEWNNRIMMQSQFYAGDAGSVSHKNVDQTATSRDRVLRTFKDVRFVEYVDGAGYFSSLNSDLKKILAMATTHSFIQIRSAPVRLRRELQAIGFCTPLEIEHAIVQTTGDEQTIGETLVGQGYGNGEIKRAIEQAVNRGTVGRNGSKLVLQENRRDVVRQHLLLDVLTIHGREMKPGSAAAPASVLVPGYGPFWGLGMDELVDVAIGEAGTFKDDISHSQTFAADIKTLAQRGLCMFGR